nr:immunoglobulin light chain junction region [Homo sapiens]
CQHLNSYPRF